jgi:hypothetical protein
MNRRNFLKTAGSVAAAAPQVQGSGASPAAAIDFRYAPLNSQTAYCFPDDHQKSLVGERGELRYGHSPRTRPLGYFTEVVEFGLLGMESNRLVSQHLESPSTPIVHTRFERPEAYLDLIAFATNDPAEGRVDNVILEVRPRSARRLRAAPRVMIGTAKETTAESTGGATQIRVGGALFMATSAAFGARWAQQSDGRGLALTFGVGKASPELPLRILFRFPQQGQDFDKIRAGLDAPDRLLESAREYWRNWSAFSSGVQWRMSGRYHEFLIACARNIQQAREVRDGKLTFQVGPTVYRGLWVVDGHFLLESARYLGYDTEAQQGLETTWAQQDPEGGIYAAAGRAHLKDTGIAIFTLVRQAELAQDWSYMRRMQPNILRAVRCLRDLRDKNLTADNACARYGVLPPGMGDGGLGGVREEFTNTLWVMAGLRAAADAARAQGIAGLEEAGALYAELRSAFLKAAKEEMRTHAAGFSYLPMLMKSDRQWSAPDEWDRPRPQCGQWAMSHAVYPGVLFDRNDPVVRGHIALMQEATQEDVPAETGWIFHEGLWTYNAAFVAHMYMWAGVPDWARLTFHGFLNHATPTYVWREEQPLRGSLVAGYIGDMPHNWASAECVLYLRHMLALEDDSRLRLVEGIGDFELAAGEPYTIANSPTRFGRLAMALEPERRGKTWRLRFKRGRGPAPSRVTLPARLGARLAFAGIEGARFQREGAQIVVAPDAGAWSATYTAGA